MSETILTNDIKQSATLKEFSSLAYLGLAGLALLFLLLGLGWQWPGASRWLLQSSLFWILICYLTHGRLDLNRPDEQSPLYDRLGWGNRLTLLRGWLVATVGGFLFQAWPDGPLISWLPGMLYFAAAMLDRVDGFVARRSNHSSLLGIELDTLSDALGLAIASLLAFGYGQIHVSYLLMGMAYYLYQGGIHWRRWRRLPVYPLPPAMHRRAWAGFQMGFLVVALWPLFHPPLTALAGFAFMTPVLLGFGVDWLIVSGRLDRDAPGVQRRFQRLTDLSQSVLQPALRLAIPLCLAVSIAQTGELMAGSTVAWFGAVLLGGFVLTSTMIVLGIAGRYFCLLLVGLLGWYYNNHPLQAIDYVLFCALVWSMLLGTGRFSLWLEDDRWLNRYDGA